MNAIQKIEQVLTEHKIKASGYIHNSESIKFIGISTQDNTDKNPCTVAVREALNNAGYIARELINPGAITPKDLLIKFN